jgi:beta-lactamase class C
MAITQDGLRQSITPIAGEFGVGMVVAAIHDKAMAIAVIGKDAAGKDLSADTVFGVASVTKLATAAAAHRLVQDGKLAYHEPISSYVAHPAGRSITLAQLLAHTSGLPTDGPDMHENDTWEKVREKMVSIEPVSEPGTEMTYSNVGYCVVGAMIENVADRAYNEVLTSLVLEPLSMNASTIGGEPRGEVAVLAGQFGDGYNHLWMPSMGMPSSGLFSTAADVLKLVTSYYRPHPRFLRPEVAAGALGDQTLYVKNSIGVLDPRGPWGLGPELLGEKKGRPHVPLTAGPRSFGHIGSAGTLVWCSPERDVAWAVLATKTIDQDQWHAKAWPRVGEAVLELADN